MTDATKMNPEAKAIWLAALNSGDYIQGHGALCRPAGYVCRPAGYEGQPTDTYCCLGVLTAEAIKLGKVALPVERFAQYVSYGQAKDFLPEEVRVWAGLEYSNPVIIKEETDCGIPGCSGHTVSRSLSNLNDAAEWGFGQIAEAIDANF